jgi:hypothetical protein
MLFTKVAMIGFVTLADPQYLESSTQGQESHEVRPDKIKDGGKNQQDDEPENDRCLSQN